MAGYPTPKQIAAATSCSRWVRSAPRSKIIYARIATATIASGIYGQESYTGGWATAAVGFLAHYFILIVAASWYFLASRYLRVLRERAVACGLLYGVAIYCTMNFIVIPMSNSPLAARAFDVTFTWPRASDFCMHLIFGLIIALSTRSYWRRAM